MPSGDAGRLRLGAADAGRRARCSPTCTSSRWRPPSSGKASAGAPRSACSSAGCRPSAAFLVAAGLEDVLEYLRGFRFSADALDYLRSLGPVRARVPGRTSRRSASPGDVRAVPRRHGALRRRAAARDHRPADRGAAARDRGDQLLPPADACSRARPRASVLAAQRPRARGVRAPAEPRHRRRHEGGARRVPGRVRLHQQRPGRPHVRRAALGDDGALVRHGVPAGARRVPAYARAFPDSAVLLLDTYDTVGRRARRRSRWRASWRPDGHRLAGVRLDSGDLARAQPRGAAILDAGGFPDVRIIVSGGLDEHDVAALLAAGRADRRVRHRHPARRLGRRALARHGLQAGELRRTRPAQGEPGKGDLGRRRSRSRDGSGARRPVGGRHARARGGAVPADSRRTAGAGDAGRTS